MKRLAAIVAVLLTTTTAHAGDSYSFDIGGRTVTIDAPSDCRSSDCVSVSIPGVFEYNTKRVRRDRDRDNRESAPAPSTPAPSVRPAPPATATVQPAPPPAAATAPTPAPAAAAAAPTAPSPSTAAVPAPVQSAPTTATAPAPNPEPAKPAPTVVANAPATNAVTNPAPTAAAAASPLGIWMTEKKEGKVRIEACGSNLCGYSMDKKTEANGEKVLINMKPGDNKWAGKIYDPNSGSTYDSTIALKGSDQLRVQGCAFGGMFCGGQTWTRVN